MLLIRDAGDDPARRLAAAAEREHRSTQLRPRMSRTAGYLTAEPQSRP